MEAKETPSRLAPPTNAPSISGWAMSFVHVVRLDTAAVQNANRLTGFAAELRRHRRPNHAMSVGGDLGRRRLSRADGPHRLVER